ncbi:MAG: alpha/beta hydrolase [Steroidobacteraceae bacterium]
MPFATINGIRIHYLIQGSGPHLLAFAPGGFRSVISRWTAAGGKGIFGDMDALAALSRHYTVIAYDRRESGLSGGRIEPLSWDLYVEEARGLLDLAGAGKAYVLGGSMGASLALALAARHPSRCKGLLLHRPVGGYRWLMQVRSLFQRHIDFVRAQGLQAVVARAPRGENFFLDAEIGPWGSLAAIDPEFASGLAQQAVEPYLEIVTRSRDALFPDTMPSGASGAELIEIRVPALIMAGADAAHATSAAWALKELMPNALLWDVLPPHQSAHNTLARFLPFTSELEK